MFVSNLYFLGSYVGKGIYFLFQTCLFLIMIGRTVKNPYWKIVLYQICLMSAISGFVMIGYYFGVYRKERLDPSSRKDPYEFKPKINITNDNPHRSLYPTAAI